jgi:hypothetical protein
MGAMLDVAEKTCEAVKEVSACATLGSEEGGCSKWIELKTFLSALDTRSPEAVWKACCYRAYKIGGYQPCKNPNAICMRALNKHVTTPKFETGLVQSLLSLEKASSKRAISKKVLPMLNEMLDRIQDARAVMWAQPGCQALAKPKPAAKCGFGGKKYDGQYHSLSRTDLYCETIEWQYNQMGAGDAYMKKCPGASFRTPAQNAAWNKKQAEEIKADLGIDISNLPKNYNLMTAMEAAP